jgi:hypothetical protein
MLLMLEDCPERVERFRAVWDALVPDQPMRVWRAVPEMIRDLPVHLPIATVISLDHDLEPVDGADPGDGMEVARFLASLAPACPVIVHTSNGDRGTLMMGELELAGWKRHRVYPLGDDWIEADWRRVVRRVLRRLSRRG